MSKWIFENRPVPRYTSVSTGSTVRQPTPIGTTTVARPPHTSALGVSSETITAYARRARGVERRPPGAGSLSLSTGTGRILTNGGFHSIFGGLSHPGSPYTNFKTTFPHQIRYTNIYTIFKI